MRLRARLLALMLSLVVSGGHVGIIQATGWMTMFTSHLCEQGDARQALATTFDGAHPCMFCHAAAALQENPGAHQAPGSRSLEKGDLSMLGMADPLGAAAIDAPVLDGLLTASHRWSASDVALAPPVPPLRMPV